MADQSEKEQLDAFRAWWSENGAYVVGGILVGVAITFGYLQYQRSTANTEIAASTLYEEVMFAAGTEDLDAAEKAANDLFEEYNRSPYAGQARLALARIYMDNARDQDAANVLSGLIETQPDSELALVGRLRLAKILLYQGKADEVIALVRDQPQNAFSARMNEILGDAYVATERFTDAEAAYAMALNDNPMAPTINTSLIQLKMNDLPLAEAGADDMADGADEVESMPAAEEPLAESTDDESGNR